MNSTIVPTHPNPIHWTLSFSGVFTEFRSLAILLERTGAVSHWAVVLNHGEGLYVEEGIIKSMTPTSFASLEWFSVSETVSLGVPLYVDANIVHESLPLIKALLNTATPACHANSEVVNSFAMADDFPFIVAMVGKDLRYQYINNHYERVFKLPKESVIGKTIADIIGIDQFEQVKPDIERALGGQPAEAQISARVPNVAGGFNHYHVVCSFTPYFKSGEVFGLYVCISDQTPLKRITLALKQFHEITTDVNITLSEKIQRVLKLGCDILNLPIGIVSHVDGDMYEVAYSFGGPDKGTVFNLGECYCVHTLSRDQVTGFYHTSQSEIATHPCYQNFKLESYLGVSLKIGGHTWGTLNFSSTQARHKDFNDDEYELVKLLGQWLQSELSKEQEQRVSQSVQKQHRLILESVHDGIVGLDEAGYIIFANPAAAQLAQIDLESLIGRPVVSLLHDSLTLSTHLKAEENPIKSAIRNRQKLNGEVASFYKNEGETFPVKYSCTPVNDEQDNLACVLAFHDISKQKIAEKALHQQMDLFRSLFMHAPEAIVVTNNKRKIVMVNPHALELFKYKEEDLIGKTPEFLYAYNSDSQSMSQAYVDESMPELAEYRMSYRKADGTEFVAENVRSKIKDEAGAFKGYIIHARDITSRLKIESEVTKVQNRLSVATDSAGIGVWEMDIQRASLIWDQRMFDLYGLAYREGPVDYKEWESFIHPEDLERVQTESDLVIDTQQDLDIVFRIQRVDGEIRYINANARTAFNSQGQASYLFGTNIDVTERYVTESILKEAREEAIRASQAKSNFLATMSHEIRTPLNGVLGMAEVLSGTELSKQQENHLNIIRSSGESLLELINEVLDFSKIEAGHFSLEEIDFDLEALVYDLSRLLVIKAESKGIELLVEYSLIDVSFVKGDPYRIRQILTNLVGNAIKFTEQGQVIIRVESEYGVAGYEIRVDISVIDTGIGISKRAQEQLFNAFTQADNSTTRKFGGTGLGLAITKQLVELMGGGISVHSAPDEGSTFKVSLPLKLSEKTDEVDIVLEPDTFEKVLVVDDNPTNLSILRNQLQQLDIEAEFQHNPLIALDNLVNAAISNKPYDLLILDYLMPEMDGIKLAEMLAELSPKDCLPHIVMISSAGTLARNDLKQANIDVCLNKPASVRDIKAGLESIMKMPLAKSRIIDQSYSVFAVNNPTQQDVYIPPAKILVVEDMRANLLVVKGILAPFDLTIETAENGQEAIERWQATNPDLILMDLHMPVMDGLTAIQEIRKMETSTGKRVPILALTADIQKERIEAVNQIGGDGYITKPFRGSELVHTIAGWLNIDAALEAEEGALMNMSTSDVLDDSVLNGLQEVLGDQVQEVVLAFQQDTHRIIEEMEEALVSNSPIDAYYRPAHSLKSVSANVGAIRLNHLAKIMEEQAKVGAIDSPQTQVQVIKNEMVNLIGALRSQGWLK